MKKMISSGVGIPNDDYMKSIDHFMRFFTLAMLFFSYFGVGTSFISIPLLGALSLDRLFAFSALAVVASGLASGRKSQNRLESVFFIYSVYILTYGFSSLLWSVDVGYSLRQYFNIGLQALLALAVLMQFGDGDEKTIDSLIVLIFIINISAGFFEMTTKHYLLQKTNEYIADYRQILGFAPPLVGFYNTNDFCIAVVQIVPIVVYRCKSLLIRILAILVVMIMVGLAWSDLALMAILAYAIYFLFSEARRSRVLTALLLLALAYFSLFLPVAIDRILGKSSIAQRVGNMANDTSFISRTALYVDALAISADHFGGGLGTGNSERVVAEYSATHADTLGKVNLHSLFLQLLVEYGWVGLFLFLALLWQIFRFTRAIPPGADPDLKTLCYGSLIMVPFTMNSSSNSITSSIGWITFSLLVLHLNPSSATAPQKALA